MCFRFDAGCPEEPVAEGAHVCRGGDEKCGLAHASVAAEHECAAPRREAINKIVQLPKL
jgi:hypothetical protein